MGDRTPVANFPRFMRSQSMSALTKSSRSLGLTREPPWLHVRREPFEYGTLPIPSLMHSDVLASLMTLRGKLLSQAPPSLTSCTSSWSLSNTTNLVCAPSTPSVSEITRRVSITGIAAALELTEEYAQLILETLASTLNDEGTIVDRLASSLVNEIESVGADIDDLLLYLYLQTYRRAPSRPHRDASSVADVWPCTSAIDGILPASTLLKAGTSICHVT